MNEYYSTYRANIHRGAYWLSAEATKMYEESRQTVADFLGAKKNEIIFTSGTTQGLNGLAFSLSKKLTKKDNVVLTRMEHHANLISWQEMSKQYGFEIRLLN
jgi:cysteine desulfurase/selenocysteine lyase